ncbi:polysaccharide biosynthesis protein [Cohnella cellulosilytica]|uniref:Polysaccharide biosynthesis protein n=1 Tax=Cohnella cellulosilytica TaxID=986710 RepID=A0ABW2FAC0_9BACL
MFQKTRLVSLLICDALLICISVYLSYLLRFDFSIRPYFLNTLPYVMISSSIFLVASFYNFKIYKRVWQYASVGDIIAIIKGVVTGTTIFFVFHQLNNYYYSHVVVPRSIYPLTIMISFLLVGSSRFIWRLFRDNYIKMQPYHRRALIVGAGEAGIMVVRELKHNRQSEMYPVAFIDDDPSKWHKEIMGIPVFGGRNDIVNVVKQYKIVDVIVALPTATRSVISEIVNISKNTGCQIKIVPRVNDLINGKITINMIREVEVEDLLGRDPIQVDMEEITGYLTDQVVLISGAGGSIGSEITRQVAATNPRNLVILDHSENNIYDIEIELRSKYPDLNLTPVIADVKNRNRIEQVIRQARPRVIFHAAAHKHVPLMEANPLEAVQNNVIGTKNLAENAHQYGVKKFVLISTDKAVNPTSVMGATKRIAEMIVQDLDKRSDTLFSAVRFGNVLGSRGSVIPLFKKQILAGGPVTVTHPEMVRYFMTIPEAVQLVIQAGAIARGGETFILDMGNPVKIADLAKDLVRLSGLEPEKDIKIVYTGIRPGEKLFEEILSHEEGASATKHDRIYIGVPIEINEDKLAASIELLRHAKTGHEVRVNLSLLVPNYRWVKEGAQQDQKEARELMNASLEMVATLELQRNQGEGK